MEHNIRWMDPFGCTHATVREKIIEGQQNAAHADRLILSEPTSLGEVLQNGT